MSDSDNPAAAARPLATRTLGRTGLEVTELGCGGSRIGNLHGVVSESDAQATVAAALAAGVRYFDVAPFYAGGLGELRLGHALRDVPRDDYVLSTKVARVYEPFPPDQSAEPGALPFSGSAPTGSTSRSSTTSTPSPTGVKPRPRNGDAKRWKEPTRRYATCGTRAWCPQSASGRTIGA